MSSLVVRSERVVLPGGTRPASIHIKDGRIARVGAHDGAATGVREMDAGDLMVLPGLVDTHVHINDPGRSAWEGFDHATRAAAAGGVTTLVDMPLNSMPPTTTVQGFNAKQRAGNGRCHVDVAFWGGIVPGNADDLELLARAGVLGFKCFLSPSGVDEFQNVTEHDLRAALPILASLGRPLLAHAELPSLLLEPDGDPHTYAAWLRTRPPAAEHGAIELLGMLSREYGVRVHVVHLASGGALPLLRGLRHDGLSITVETCPHYLTFAAEDIPDGGTLWKCAPPIRERSHREALWRALASGDIDLIASDHSPAPPSLKRVEDGDFLAAWGGIASLQVGLPAVWTEASKRGLSIDHVAGWMSSAPARLAGLDGWKGCIAEGCDADLVVFDPDAEWTVDPAQLHHRHALTPYAGMTLKGVVRTTLLRGETIFKDGKVMPAVSGRMIASRS